MPSAQGEQTRNITIGPIGLDGVLGVPQSSGGIVLFAHGSGSGRFSPRSGDNFNVSHGFALDQSQTAAMRLIRTTTNVSG